ncbi:dTMP kinase [Spiribacter vilamensis]|uniref:Thymidylate kinase n=1 Tax=Spiribacter vilamensis TaxID=531306 RepID=A0A4Q8CZT7_9GAMM|nr:dTMP kinase [Spiribacter vilamensis]RZU98533.1 thymidylate kinase [Spiribacter vilamensis]TVO60606.1 dTMP kinase [Spiribacter vilamensis]
MDTRRFITIEGIEGAGKTSALTTVSDWIIARGDDPLITREPGGTALGEELRAVLLGHREQGMSAEAEVLLMFAARAEHLETVIKPALQAGRWVICDRFTDASLAYQGGGRGLGVERVRGLAEWLMGDLRPGLTLWLDLPVATGLARAAGRSAPDRFESEHQRFFEAVRSAYAQIARTEPDRIRRVDASPALERVQATITTILSARFDD